jgi:hypothetical protein
LLCGYTLTFPYWSEIGTWLAVGETYALAGLGLFIWGMREVLLPQGSVRKDARVAGSLAVLLGAVLCIGSKENFVLLCIPCLYLACRGIRERNAAAWLPASAGVLYCALIIFGVLRAVVRSGVDFYGNSVSLPARVGVVLAAIRIPANATALATLVTLMAGLLVLLAFRWHDDRIKIPILRAQFWLACLILIYISQLYFYDGAWPTGQRFDFPGMLYIPAAIYILFDLGISLVRETERAIPTRAARLALVAVLTALTFFKGYATTIRFVTDYVDSTKRFARHLQHISAVLNVNRDSALVIESGRPGDFRWIFAYDRFLRAYGVTNKLFVRIHGYPPESTDSAEDHRATSILLQISEEGRSIYDWLNHVGRSSLRHDPGYSPLRELDDFGSRCFSLSLSGHFETECQPID